MLAKSSVQPLKPARRFVATHFALPVRWRKAANAAGSRANTIQCESESNRLLAASIAASPQIVQMKAIEKWDGHLPTYSGGGNLPFIGNMTK